MDTSLILLLIITSILSGGNMSFTISKEEFLYALNIDHELELHSWNEDERTELLFKLKGLREYFLTNPRKDFSTITIDSNFVQIEHEGDFPYHILIQLEIDLFIQYDTESDDLILSLSEDSYRVRDIDVIDMDCGKPVEDEFTVFAGKSKKDFINENALLISKTIFERVDSQPIFDAIDYISTCLRYLTPTGKKLTGKYMDDLMEDDELETSVIQKKKSPTLLD